MTAFALKKTFASAAISAMMLAISAPVVAGDDLDGNDQESRLVIYFTRHAEKQTVTVPTSDFVPVYTSMLNEETGEVEFFADASATTSKGNSLDQVCGVSKCAEELSNQGEERALLLADWFARRGVTDDLDAVYATHKTRTQQTVMPTATAAGMVVTVLNPEFSELNPESTGPSECSTLQAIESAQANGLDTILIAGHSGTLYDIMGSGVTDCYDEVTGAPLEGLGLDTGNTVPDTGNSDRFPKDSKGKVRDFGDVFKVVVARNGDVRFAYRVNLQQPARLKVDNITR